MLLAAGERQVLHGHVPAAATQSATLHRLEATNRLHLAIVLPLRNQVALDSLLQELYDPANTNYHHFLTVADFTRRFGPATEDYQAVETFFRTNGFAVKTKYANRVVLDVEGAVPDIERTFHVKMQVFRHPTEVRDFYSPDTEPAIDLPVSVLRVGGLENYALPRSQLHQRPLAGPNAEALPQGTGSGPSSTYVGPNFRAAYAPGVTQIGAGQFIGLVEFQGYYAADIQNYYTNYLKSAFNLPYLAPTYVLLDGVSSITANAGGAECPLDIEMAMSMAPGAQVIVYYGSSDYDILNSIATANVAKQIGASWTWSDVGGDDGLFQEMAAQGQSYFNASGDGDARQPGFPDVNGNVSAPVDSPYITSVGGTTLTTAGGATGAWSAESVWNWGGGTGSSGGVSTLYTIPWWQQGINMRANGGSTTMRNYPDVALTADSIWVLYNNGSSGSYGGTSCATPLWAGFLALANQLAVSNGLSTVGFINPTIYAIGKGINANSYAATLHDTTSGNNTSTASPNRYYAVTGYDLATGWGSPNGSNLLNALVFSEFEPLVVNQTNGFTTAGPVGGPFIPTNLVFSLNNYGASTLNWSVINTSAWFGVSSGSGSLASGASVNVTVSVGTSANSLSAGYYSASLLFSNQSTHVVQSRLLALNVGSSGLVWNSAGTNAAGAQDGSGTWADQSNVNANTNWWNGAANIVWNNGGPDIATFGANNGAAGTVTLSGGVTAGGIIFNPPGSSNYTVASGGDVLTLDGYIAANTSATISAPLMMGLPGTFTVAGGQTLTVSSVIAGGASNNLAIAGPGTVSLTGQNNSGAAAGMAGAVTVNAGTLALNSSSSYGALGNVSGVTVGAGGVLSLQGVNAISGSSGAARNLTVNLGGAVTNAGAGNHALGTVTLNGGTLTGVGSPTAGSFNVAGDIFVNSNSTVSAQNLTTAATTSLSVANGQTFTLMGTMIGSGTLTFSGSGTAIFATNNTYSGGTTINYGTVQLGNGGAGGSLGSGPVVNDAQLQFNRNDNFIWTTPVADPGVAGKFVKANTNTMTVLSTNIFSATSGGVVQVNGGTLQINSPGVMQSGAEFWIAQNATTGACVVAGGTLTATSWLAVGRNNSAANGTLTVNSGLVQELGNGGNLMVGALGSTGTLTVNGGAVSNAAALWLGESSGGKGTLNLNGGLVQASQVTPSLNNSGGTATVNFNGGTLQATTNQANFLSVNQALVQAGGAVIDDGGYSVGIIQPLLNSGGGGLTKNGFGMLNLSATNTYAGTTTVNAGTLRLADPVLHFSFDNVSGSTVVNDGAGGAALNGTLIGTNLSIVAGGRFGNALKIGAGAVNASYVAVSNAVVPLNGSGTWTVAMWVKTTVAGSAFLYQGDAGWVSGNTTFYLNQNSSSSGGTKAGGVRWGANWEEGTTTLNDGNWHFVALVDNVGTKSLFVDGHTDTLAANGWGSATGVGGQIWIGGSADTGDGIVTATNGLIDEVYIYNRALSLTDVQSLTNSNAVLNHQVLPPATAVTVNAGATLDLGGLNQTIGSLAGASGSSVQLATGTNTDTLTVGNSSNTTFAGALSGNGSLAKTAAGTLTLAGANNYSGSTTVSAGTLTFGTETLQPVLHFTFDQVGGSVVTNIGTGGAAMNGTLTGSASVVSGGRYGKALSIPSGAATAAYVLVNNSVVPLNGTAGSSWTVGMWLKTSTVGAVYLYQGAGSWASGNTEFYLGNGTQADGAGTHAGGVRWGQGWQSGTATISDGNWHFVVMACNNGVKAMFVDGAVDALLSGGQSSWTGSGTGSQVRIGGTATGADSQIGFNGLIDEVYMFNRALSQGEIQNLMNNTINFAGNLPPVSVVSVAAGATLDLAGSAQTVAALSGAGVVTNSAATVAALTINNFSNTTFSGQINDAASGNAISLIKSGAAVQILAGANTYSGLTTISNGMLLVNGSLGTNAVTINSGTLGGNGVIGGLVTVRPGGTLSAGAATNTIGTLVISNNLNLAGTTYLKLNASASTNDSITGLATVTYGGTLTVTNLSGTLAAGNSFQLFKAAAYSGFFTASNLPPLPAGLLWNTASLTNGTLTIVAPDFGIAVAPVSGGVPVGSNAVYNVTITASNLFGGNVALSVSGLPAGAGAMFNPAIIAGSGTSTLAIVTSNNIAVGNYPLTITGTNADFNLTHSAVATLSVTDFTLAVTPVLQSVFAGSGTNFTVNLGASNSFTGTLTLSVSGLPAGAGYTLSQTNVSAPAAVTLNVITSELVVTNSYGLTISGASGNLTHTTQVSLVVQHLPASLAWNSVGDGNWDIATSANWLDVNTLSGAFFYPGDAVLFGDVPGVVTNIILAAGVAVQPANMTVDADTNNYTFSGAGKISGATGLLKLGGSVLTLATTNDFTGNAVIQAGTLALAGGGSVDGSATIQIMAGALLDVSSQMNGTLTLNAGQSLEGNGAINGSVVVNAGATLWPGTNSIGTLTVSNSLTLAASSTTVMAITPAQPTNAAVLVGGTLAYGGTLTVTNVGGALTAGSSFQLFNATNCSGTFAALNLPALAAGLAWNTIELTNGFLGVITAFPPQFASIAQTADGNFQLGGTGSANVTYELDSTTNLTPPIIWNFVTNTVADQNGLFQFSDLQATNYSQRFYRVKSGQ